MCRYRSKFELRKHYLYAYENSPHEKKVDGAFRNTKSSFTKLHCEGRKHYFNSKVIMKISVNGWKLRNKQQVMCEVLTTPHMFVAWNQRHVASSNSWNTPKAKRSAFKIRLWFIIYVLLSYHRNQGIYCYSHIFLMLHFAPILLWNVFSGVADTGLGSLQLSCYQLRVNSSWTSVIRTSDTKPNR